MLQLKENPPLSYSGTASGEELTDEDWQQHWTVAYCKSRQEKALAEDLCQHGVTYFLPMVLRETSSGGRRRRNMYPLFTSYLFFAGDEEARLAALRTDRILHLIEVDEPRQSMLRRELADLEKALRFAPSSIELHPRLVPGARVKIKSGPLKGVEGAVIRSDNKRKLWLGVSALGVGATIEIPADLVDAYG
jgi:transcription antitermination factor NusG